MSVEKVNKYKEYKKNKKEILEKEKKKGRLYRLCGYIALAVVLVGFLAMIGITAKNQYTKYQASKPDYSTTSMDVTDMTGILEALEPEHVHEEDSVVETEEAIEEATEVATEEAETAATEAAESETAETEAE